MENKIKDFKNLIENDKLSHAYFFYGEEYNAGQEKFNFAQSIANFLENGAFGLPEKALREFLVVSPESQPEPGGRGIGIESIRFLKHFLWQKPTNSSRRTAVVKEAEKLTPEAQNAALKIVEEPPESALIIFISNFGDNLFPALASRLQKIHFSSPARRTAADSGFSLEKIEEIVENGQIDGFFESLIADLKKDPVKNYGRLKEVLRKLTVMKQFNVNKRLQLKALTKGFAQKSDSP